jgi:tol-pal system protein YbgF
VIVAWAMSIPAFAANKDLIQLQTQVQGLADQMSRMQQSFDERMGIMRNLIEQSTDSANKLSFNLEVIAKSMQKESSDSQARMDQLSGQVQSLHDAVDELRARLTKMSQQLDALSTAGQNLPGPSAAQPQAAPSPAPPPKILYDNALRDYNSGRYDLATQQFNDYLKYYPGTDLASNSQFYLAEIESKQGNFQQAVKDYDKVLEQGGNKAPAAQLKKGFALLELGQREAGIRELKNLVQRYPTSMEAATARDRLKKLGATAASTKPSAIKKH